MILLFNKDNGSKLVSPHFNSDEFICPCCGYALFDSELAIVLERIRTLIDKPITVNSGYRCPRHNAAIGGALMSRHLIGCAADITWSGIELFTDKNAVFRKTLLPSVTGTWNTKLYGVGWGKTFIHVDTDVTRNRLTQWEY